ncbi:tyrosine-type recombinase/integrase [Streptomyces sp. NPDC059991]|uniref:tyrosine-type recombinase/integrase n=1 Tax=Streptomyces sp. NPDC059991 TaxID=3347028 RepID=UPI0036943F57
MDAVPAQTESLSFAHAAPTVLDRLRQLSKEAGVPQVTVHGLRHLAATITHHRRRPLTVVSKTLGHSTLSATANIYSHLTQQTAREAVDANDHTLTGAEKAPRKRPYSVAATTMAPDTRKAALPLARERPPTCVKQSRDDRI